MDTAYWMNIKNVTFYFENYKHICIICMVLYKCMLINVFLNHFWKLYIKSKLHGLWSMDLYFWHWWTSVILLLHCTILNIKIIDPAYMKTFPEYWTLKAPVCLNVWETLRCMIKAILKAALEHQNNIVLNVHLTFLLNCFYIN